MHFALITSTARKHCWSMQGTGVVMWLKPEDFNTQSCLHAQLLETPVWLCPCLRLGGVCKRRCGGREPSGAIQPNPLCWPRSVLLTDTPENRSVIPWAAGHCIPAEEPSATSIHWGFRWSLTLQIDTLFCVLGDNLAFILSWPSQRSLSWYLTMSPCTPYWEKGGFNTEYTIYTTSSGQT